MKEMKKINHNNMLLTIYDNGHFDIRPNDFCAFPEKVETDFANFELGVGTKKLVKLSSFSFEGVSTDGSATILTYVYAGKLKVTLRLTPVDGADCFIQQNTVTNISDGDIILNRFSSCVLTDVCSNAEVPYYENEALKIHICNNKWQNEGQWQSFSPEQLGLFPATTHDWERESYTISSIGSWSTANYYPMTAVCDEKNNLCYFLETEGSHSWAIKYTAFGGYDLPSLHLEATGADERLDWGYTLKPGCSYTAERAVFGVTNGGFENAVRQLLVFKRADSTAAYRNGILPVIFNVYMDCIWGAPTPEKLFPLADKASRIGAEIFVIDGGWSKNQNGPGYGDWIPNEKYDKTSLSEVISYINRLGMKAGIWTELDTVSETAYGFTLDDDAVLTKNGEPIGEGKHFYNMKNEKVRAYLKSRVDYLYSLGFRYIKNDYNHSVGIGPDNNNEHSCLEGARQNSDAFAELIEEIRAKYPDLIIENCGSGALRSDNKMLRHFHVQSTSDQELYLNNPSILMGSATQMPPEKCGMWSYPYPAYFEVRDNFVADDDYKAKRADGCETAFNMVTAMMGTIFLSGRIDCCDDRNLSLIKSAVEKYKSFRSVIPNSYPIYPTGMCNINHKGCHSFGLVGDGKLILAVWNIGKKQDFKLDLTGYIKGGRFADSYFADNSLSFTYDRDILDVSFKSDNSALLIEIEF